MTKLFSYVIKIDAGAAPNPFWNLCTLTICKPVIRRTANVGDWILGFGSTHVKLKGPGVANYSCKLVYAMKVTQKMTLEEYNIFCIEALKNKMPVFRTDDWRKRLGDCIYSFSNDKVVQRQSVHNKEHIATDLSGIHSLLSDHFYYFGNKAIDVPISFTNLIHKGRGHKVTNDKKLINDFEIWMSGFKKNKIYGDPQYRHKYDINYDQSIQLVNRKGQFLQTNNYGKYTFKRRITTLLVTTDYSSTRVSFGNDEIICTTGRRANY